MKITDCGSKTLAQTEHEGHMAMRDMASFTKDGLLTDKMRYRKALLLACAGDEAKAQQFLRAVDGETRPLDASVESLAAQLERNASVQEAPHEFERAK
jgi:hypothetical protein